MRRTAGILEVAVSLSSATALQAQKKCKDEMLHQYRVEEFGKLNAELAQRNDRLTAFEAELGRLKLQQADLNSELRNAQNILKATDTSLTSFRLTSQQDLFSLKTNLAQVRQEVAGVAELIKKGAAAPAPREAPAPVAEAPSPDGYITARDDEEMTIHLGAKAGVKVSSRFNVFRAAEPRVQIGVVELAEVIDADDSRAKIVFSKPNTRFDFSDIVRPIQ